MPLGHGLAVSQLSTIVSQDEPQKNLDSVSSTAVSGAVVAELSFPDASEDIGFPPAGLSSAIGSLDLQGVPLKHSCFSGQSSRSNTAMRLVKTCKIITCLAH